MEVAGLLSPEPQGGDCSVNPQEEVDASQVVQTQGDLVPVEAQIEDSGLGICHSSHLSKEVAPLNPVTGKDYHVKGRTFVPNAPRYVQAVKELATKEFIHNLRITNIAGTRSLQYGLNTRKVIAKMMNDFRENIVRCEESHPIQYFLKRGL